MSKSLKASRLRAKAGFTLFEILVALAVAAVFLPVVSQGFGAAWSASRRGDETILGLTLARALAADLAANQKISSAAGATQGFRFRIEAAPLRIEKRASLLPPPPGPVKPAAPEGGPPPGGKLFRVTVTVTVTAPSGRRLQYETVKRQIAPN